jgi:hypothetical protein
LLSQSIHLVSAALSDMEERELNQDMLRFLRQITSDGVIDREEVWDLGLFLKENEAARNTWPGDSLWGTLEEIFADDVVDADEVAHLEKEIHGIELECQKRSPAPADSPAAPELTASEVSLPQVDLQLDIESQIPNKPASKVDLNTHSCTCSDWLNNRQNNPARTIARMCRCMATGFELAINAKPGEAESWGAHFIDLARLLSTYGLGGVAEANWRVLHGPGLEYFVSWDQGPWASVFADNGEGIFERFGYQRTEKRWSYGVRPTGAAALEKFFGDQNQSDDGNTVFLKK